MSNFVSDYPEALRETDTFALSCNTIFRNRN